MFYSSRKINIGVASIIFGFWMVEKEGEVVSAKVPANIKVAITKALKKGLAMNESDYLREAIIKKLKEDELL